MKIGIRARVLFLTLAPAILTAVGLVIYLTHARLKDLEKSAMDEAQTLASQFASACAYGVAHDNRGLIQALAQSLLAETKVRKILVEDGAGLTLVDLVSHQDAGTSSADEDLLVAEAPIPNDRIAETESSAPATIGRIRLEYSLDQSRDLRRQIILTSISITFFCLLVAAVLGQSAGRKVADLLLRLEKAIQELRSTHRVLSPGESAVIEFGDLECDIDAMVSALKSSHQHLQEQIDEATAELRQTLEELEIKNVELDIARKKAIQASRVKSEFLANMSHEIRTPMNGVMGFITLLSKTTLNRTQRAYLRTLRASAENLMVILNDILDFSKIEAGKFKIRRRNFELRETLENAVLLFAANAQYKGIKLILDIEPDVPSNVIGDASRMAQIVTNFVSNAIKFTDSGEIEVRVRRISESASNVLLKLVIRDTGIGISPADQKHLFNAFYQLDTSKTRRYSGTGLGLAICHRLVSMMDGKIRVQSQPGKGSIFSITLRLAKQETAINRSELLQTETGSALIVSADPLLSRAVTHILEYGGIACRRAEMFSTIVDHFHGTIDIENKPPSIIIIDDSCIDTASESLLAKIDSTALQRCKLILIGVNEDHPALHFLPHFFTTIQFANKPPTSRELLTLLDARSRPISPDEDAERFGDEYGPVRTIPFEAKVLLADDNLINRQLARIFLNQIGAHVDEATNGLEAIKACSGERYDLILMDIHMPNMDGLEATRQIRALKNNPNCNTPIIALTADVMNQEWSHYMRVGVNDYLAKPITESALRQVLAKWCHEHSQLYAVSP